MSDLMRKHEMTEEDIKLQFITPAIEGAGWDRQRQMKISPEKSKQAKSNYLPMMCFLFDSGSKHQ